MRIPNYKIDDMVATLSEFENYNGTISGFYEDNTGYYTVMHWRTIILEYDTEAGRIEHLASDYISQTTSTLVGRILRALPKQAVSDELSRHHYEHDPKRTRQLRAMAKV